MLKRRFEIPILASCLLLSFPALASEESTYLDREYSFSLGYPKSLKMRDFGGGYFGGRTCFLSDVQNSQNERFGRRIFWRVVLVFSRMPKSLKMRVLEAPKRET